MGKQPLTNNNKSGLMSPEVQPEFAIDNALLPKEGIFLPSITHEELNLPTRTYHEQKYIGGAVVNITHEAPDNPQDLLDAHPKIIAHGYCGPEIAYVKLRHEMAKNGMWVTTWDSPRRQDLLSGIHKNHINKPWRLLSQAAWAATKSAYKPAALYGYDLEEQSDLIGHSMGGWTVTCAALNHPDFVRSVILNEPAGLEDYTSTLMMIKRLGSFATHELKKLDTKTLAGSFGYVGKNPVKTLAEGLAVSNYKIRNRVIELGKYGISSAVIVGEKDSLVHAAKTRDHCQGAVDIIATYGDPEADHVYPQTHPRETAMATSEIVRLLNPSRPAKSPRGRQAA